MYVEGVTWVGGIYTQCTHYLALVVQNITQEPNQNYWWVWGILEPKMRWRHYKAVPQLDTWVSQKLCRKCEADSIGQDNIETLKIGVEPVQLCLPKDVTKISLCPLAASPTRSFTSTSGHGHSWTTSRDRKKQSVYPRDCRLLYKVDRGFPCVKYGGTHRGRIVCIQFCLSFWSSWLSPHWPGPQFWFQAIEWNL